MTESWVQEKSLNFKQRAEVYPDRLLDIWEGLPEGYLYLFPQKIILLFRILQLSKKYNEPILLQDVANIQTSLEQSMSNIRCNFDTDKEFFEGQCKLSKDQLYRFIDRLIIAANEWQYYMTKTDPYNILMDSPELKIRGDIVIANPKYIFTDIEHPTEADFIKRNIYGLIRHTQMADYGFKTYDIQSRNRISEFFVPTESVCVMHLEDAMRVNPEFHNTLALPYLCTCIRGFKGTAQIKVKLKTYSDHNHGISMYASSVHINGTQNGVPISFSTWGV